MRILIVEDDNLIRLSLVSLLKKKGEVIEASSYEGALLHLSQKFDMAFFDLDLDIPLAGLKLVQAFREIPYKIVLTAHEEEEYVREAYEAGAEDYLVKPFERELIDEIFHAYEVKTKGETLLQDFFSTIFITGDAELKQEVQKLVEIALSTQPILLEGESGTGKTLLGKMLHGFSKRENFVHLNCSELTEGLLESELFGHKKGAFTGAVSDKTGKLLLAHQGTLFLDELGTMPMTLQKKLLRVIEDKSFYPLGSNELLTSDFRLIAATKDDLKKMIADKEFREDLYFRIAGKSFTIPPLRHRVNDIELQLNALLKDQKRKILFSKEAKEAFLNYAFMGNTRELKQIVHSLVLLKKGIIEKSDLPFVEQKIMPEEFSHFAQVNNGLADYIEKVENAVFTECFRKNSGKVRAVMAELKLSTGSYYRIFERIKDEL